MSRHRAFTLVELLVVIAIIVALLAILLPSLGKATEAANRAVCGSNQRQIAVAMLAYRSDSKMAYPFQDARGGEFAKTHAITDVSHRPNWIWSMWKYIGEDNEVLYCPSIQDTVTPGSAFYADQPDEYFGYVMNGVVSHFGGRNVRSPSDTAVTQDDPFIENGAILRPHWAYSSDPSATAAGWSGWMRFDSGEDIGTRPHDGKVLGFMDGHTAYVASPDLTSRDFGLLINGNDTYEAPVSGYGAAGRIGTMIP